MTRAEKSLHPLRQAEIIIPPDPNQEEAFLASVVLMIYAQQAERPLWQRANDTAGLREFIQEEAEELVAALLDLEDESAQSLMDVASEFADVIYLTLKYCSAKGLNLNVSVPVINSKNRGLSSGQLAAKVLEKAASLVVLGEDGSEDQERLVRNLLRSTFLLAENLDIAIEEALFFKMVRNELKYERPFFQQGDYEVAAKDAKAVWIGSGGDELFIEFWVTEREKILKLISPFFQEEFNFYKLTSECVRAAISRISQWWSKYYFKKVLMADIVALEKQMRVRKDGSTRATNEHGFWKGSTPDVIAFVTSSPAKIKTLCQSLQAYEAFVPSVSLEIDELNQVSALGLWNEVPVLVIPNITDFDDKDDPVKAAMLKARAVAKVFAAGGTNAVVIATENANKTKEMTRSQSHSHLLPEVDLFADDLMPSLETSRHTESLLAEALPIPIDAEYQLTTRTGICVVRTGGGFEEYVETSAVGAVSRNASYVDATYSGLGATDEGIHRYLIDLVNSGTLDRGQLLALIDENVREQARDWTKEELRRYIQMQLAGVPLFLIEGLMEQTINTQVIGIQ